MFPTLIKELRHGWEGYRAGSRTDKNHPIHNLVLYEFKKAIESWIPTKENYIVKGSDGQGNILRTPWVAILDKDVTTSATEGYYFSLSF
jgi:hypothetical protein